MSILSIDETFDPLFEKIWRMWAQGWDRYGSWNEAYMKRFNEQFMTALRERGDYFHNAINQAVVTTRIWDRRIPNSAFDQISGLAIELAKIVQTIEPEAKYISVDFASTISGSDRCLPNVKINFDSEWFGKDYRTDIYGPWHERHSLCCTHISYDTANIQGYQNSRPDARPCPTFGELYPESQIWKKLRTSDWNLESKQDKYKHHTFFPEGESDLYVKPRQ